MADVQPPLDHLHPAPGRFRMSANLEAEMRGVGLDPRSLALYSRLPIDLVRAVLESRVASKRVLVQIRRGLIVAARYADRSADHITLAYLAEEAE